jgi:hypothetical protein
MTIRKIALVLIVFALTTGQAFASVNFEFIAEAGSVNSELNMPLSIASDENCEQSNCACAETECSDGLMQDCTYAAGNMRCSSGVSVPLLGPHKLVMQDIGHFIPVDYRIPIYQDISLGITPRPPKAFT